MKLPDFTFEKSIILTKTRFLLGIDEVGRGPWAGPVTIGAFLLDLDNFNPDDFTKIGVRDSKLLSSQKRQAIKIYLRDSGFRYLTLSASSIEIDQQGIGATITKLIDLALDSFRGSFDSAILDGNLKHPSPSVISCVKADSLCFSVAAASIVAKVDRDHQMDNLGKQYPVYGFSAHKGYGTKAHFEALKANGPCPVHRFSYKPIKELVKISS
jgi:ribonuclease HII